MVGFPCMHPYPHNNAASSNHAHAICVLSASQWPTAVNSPVLQLHAVSAAQQDNGTEHCRLSQQTKHTASSFQHPHSALSPNPKGMSNLLPTCSRLPQGMHTHALLHNPEPQARLLKHVSEPRQHMHILLVTHATITVTAAGAVKWHIRSAADD